MKPNTREEYYLAKMAGEDIALPEAITREEEYLAAIAENIQGASSNISDEFSSTSSYNKDDYCIYNGVLYKANISISAGSDFDETEWTETTLTDELGNSGGGGGSAPELIDTIKARTTGAVTAATIENNSYIKDGVAYIDIIYNATEGGSSGPYIIIEGLPVPKRETSVSGGTYFPATFLSGTGVQSNANTGAGIIHCENDTDETAVLGIGHTGAAAPGITWYFKTSYIVKGE
jgi:hypothetical protein